MTPPLFSEAARNPESLISAVAFMLPAHPPMPCFGVASETNDERGRRYSFRKICVTRSLKAADISTGAYFTACAGGVCQSIALTSAERFAFKSNSNGIHQRRAP